MQSRVCRSGIKWFKHAAIPGPCLKSRLAEQQKQKLSDSKVSACLLVVYAATIVQFFYSVFMPLWFSMIISIRKTRWNHCSTACFMISKPCLVHKCLHSLYVTTQRLLKPAAHTLLSSQIIIR